MTIPQIILIAVGSKVISLSIDIHNGIKILKEIGDEGYILNENYKDIMDSVINSNRTVSGNIKLQKFISYIPLINILNSTYKIGLVEKNLPTAITSTHVLGMLDKMTPEEEQTYKNNRSFITFVQIMNKRKEQIKNSVTINLNEIINEEGTITYTKDSEGNIKIIEASGYGNLLTPDKKIELIKSTLNSNNETKPEEVKENNNSNTTINLNIYINNQKVTDENISRTRKKF